MSVFKRGDIFHYQVMVKGRRYRGSTEEKTIGKARTFESLLIAEILSGGGPINPQLRKAPVLSDFAVQFLKHIDQITEAKQLDKDTRRCYASGWRLLSETKIAGMRIDQISTGDAAELTFPGSASNANMALRTLRRILSYACEVKIMRAAPKIKLLEEHGREAIIEPWVEGLLLECAPDYLADMIVIMLDCGMRPEEVRRMRWEHILWERNVILVPDGKSSNARRHVGMTDRMRSRLRVTQQGNESPWVFPAKSASGHRVQSGKAWSQTLTAAKREAKKQKLPRLPDGLVLYSARHTFATNFLAAGGDLAKLMVLMGHSSIMTTQKYLHPSVADAAELMNRHNRSKGMRIVKSA